ncbi:AraC family transcriptional activator of tynA and feaB [Aeromicrobium sp. SORGH_AS981]|uniref:helix-turn-helix domain-containing protein n=1 Tax=Aeromicrobium sp. SORGH_AS_0981 TaxID=3041802 RepID=UPI00285D8D7B|nr:helix-turn-helix domain-containing protein [Aeromicrobium sp. SORGH_AS_0981]MDR6116936.1 AraC family transcriptional activator of tynA and feaB [Aeromicrobium sp. SORGH_AS_0981]
MLSESTPATHHRVQDERGWRSLLREHFVPLDVGHRRADLSGAVESRMLGHVQVSTVSSVDQEISRPASLLRDGEALMQVGLVRSGEAVVEQDGRRAHLRPGDFVLYESARPFDWNLRAPTGSPQWELSVYSWRRDDFRLSEGFSRDVTARAFVADEGMGRVLSNLLCSVLDEQETLGLGHDGEVADHIGDLIAVAAQSLPRGATALGAAGGGSAVSLLARADAFIDANLADPDLGPAQVADAIAVSTRQLHRLFATRDQTVAQTIRSRRLHGARREIRSSIARDKSLREIARNWGFVDLAVFGRAFRQAFGTSPREYRQLMCAVSGDPRAVTRPHR